MTSMAWRMYLESLADGPGGKSIFKTAFSHLFNAGPQKPQL